MNNKSNARAKQLFSLPVSPLAKENGHNKNKLQQHPFLQNYSLSTNPKTLKLESNFDDDNEESSDIKEDDSGDENSPTDPTVCYLHIYLLLSKMQVPNRVVLFWTCFSLVFYIKKTR